MKVRALFVAIALALPLLVPRPARAEVRTFSAAETFSLKNVGPTSFRTPLAVPATGVGKASCTAAVNGNQFMGPVPAPVFVRVDMYAGDKVIATMVGVTLVVASTSVSSATSPLTCAVTLPSGAALPAFASGKLTLDVPTEVQAPTVSATYLYGTPTIGVGTEGYHPVDYAPPGARVKIAGTFLRLASVRIASLRADPISPSGDTSLYFVMPTLPVGIYQLVVENPLGRVSVPWFVGTRRPEIDKATIDTFGRITVWGHDFSPVFTSGGTMVRTMIRFGDGDWMPAWGNDRTITYTSPKGVFHAMVRVKTFAGDSNDVWF